MKFFVILILSFFVVLPTSVAAESFGIAATVNEDAISESDVNDRIKLLLISSGVQNTRENRSKARTQAISILIEEQLKLQEAERQNLNVTSEEVNAGLQTMASQNQMTAEQFAGILGQQGIPKKTLLDQIKAQIAWRKVVSNVLRPRIDVSENDVNARMERIKDNIGKIEYQAAEIFLPVNSKEEEADTKQLAQKLISEIKKGNVPFAVVAAQFSKSANAGQGGAMGWIQEGELPKELDLVLKSLGEGQISPPVRSLSGFHVLTLIKKRAVSGETMPAEGDVLNAIGLQRLDRLQRRYLSDIRSAAFIDRRG